VNHKDILCSISGQMVWRVLETSSIFIDDEFYLYLSPLISLCFLFIIYQGLYCRIGISLNQTFWMFVFGDFVS
jgi:hypothetical protein